MIDMVICSLTFVNVAYVMRKIYKNDQIVSKLKP